MIQHKKFTKNLLLTISILIVSSCGADGSSYQSAPEVSSVDGAAEGSDNLPMNTTSSFSAILVSGAEFESSKVLATQPLALWFWAPG